MTDKKLTVYHGSESKFESFDYTHVGRHATGLGRGFYFSTSESIARGYTNQDSGFVYTCEITLKKELNSKKRTLTQAQIKKFMIMLGDSYLENWHYNRVIALKMALENETSYNDSDVDLIHSILNACGEHEKGFELLERLFGINYIVEHYNGFEGESPHDVYVILKESDVKIIDRIEVIQS